MKRGFHLLDGMLAAFIIVVSVQGALLLSKRAKEAETSVIEKTRAWEIMRLLRQIPHSVLENNASMDFTYSGEQTESGGYFHADISKKSSSHAIGYDISLKFQSITGEELCIQATRWVDHYE
ncbi:MAG: hypothetical protein CSA81_00030 [Acidobacteria bacterium]|nr:MAG: hypothetical protein CSA81_00030 [Acidobacteriota bacterium]PIE91604.1 MAG: hypothetical protein CR997_00175 [Acidobacteriota bacterium]